MKLDRQSAIRSAANYTDRTESPHEQHKALAETDCGNVISEGRGARSWSLFLYVCVDLCRHGRFYLMSLLLRFGS
ncbi:unnamed protein product [Calypogeia fissa]